MENLTSKFRFAKIFFWLIEALAIVTLFVTFFVSPEYETLMLVISAVLSLSGVVVTMIEVFKILNLTIAALILVDPETIISVAESIDATDNTCAETYAEFSERLEAEEKRIAELEEKIKRLRIR